MNEASSRQFCNIQLENLHFSGISFPPQSTLKVDYVNDKKEGVGIVLSSKKTIIARLTFHDDKLDGLCVFFDSKGMKEKECVFVNDVHNGWGREYKNDVVVFEGVYNNGERFSELIKYSGNDSFTEERKDAKTLCVCRYNNNCKRDGLCYVYENGVMRSEVSYDNGVEKRKTREFNDSEMIEYDENLLMIYKGEYCGSISEGFKRSGKGNEFVYSNNRVIEKIELENDVRKRRWVLSDSEMKEYKGDDLVYEGGYCLCDEEYKRNGRGLVICSSFEVYVALFDNGVEKRKVKEANSIEMIEKDDYRVIYKGGFEKNGSTLNRHGKGQLFEYDGSPVKKVYDSDNGMKTVKRMEFHHNQMNEFNEDGGLIYNGEFIGNARDGFVRDGEGEEYENESLVYSGGWKNGTRYGNGLLYEDNVIRYNGEWKDGEWNGYGKIYDKEGNVSIEGLWMGLCDGEMNYEGEWKEYECGANRIVRYGRPEGHGKYTENGVLVYEGEWKNGCPDGKGEYYVNGNVKKGMWKKEKCEISKGLWYDMVLKSYYMVNASGICFYVGDYSKESPNGHGKIVNGSGEVIEGEWENGILRLSDEKYLEIANAIVYECEIRKTGLFGCRRSIIQNEYEVEEVIENVKREKLWSDGICVWLVDELLINEDNLMLRVKGDCKDVREVYELLY